jgi:hypothetical protein
MSDTRPAFACMAGCCHVHNSCCLHCCFLSPHQPALPTNGTNATFDTHNMVC